MNEAKKKTHTMRNKKPLSPFPFLLIRPLFAKCRKVQDQVQLQGQPAAVPPMTVLQLIINPANSHNNVEKQKKSEK